jgi:pilus assembly protein Flp/PilA
MKIKQLFKAILNCDSGATAVEYGLIVSLLVIAIISSLNIFANESIGMWGRVQTAVQDAQ